MVKQSSSSVRRFIQTWAGSCWRTDITWTRSLMMKIWTWFPRKPWAPPSAAARRCRPAVCSDPNTTPETDTTSVSDHQRSVCVCESIRNTVNVFKTTELFSLWSFKAKHFQFWPACEWFIVRNLWNRSRTLHTCRKSPKIIIKHKQLYLENRHSTM